MRSIASSNNAMERFEQESYGSKRMVFTSALNAIRTNRSMIISAQIRTLPEIRNALKDSSVSVDYRGAWDYLADEIAQGYDGVEFPQQLKHLAQLASEWGIAESVKLPTKKHLGWGILFEQGPRLNIGNLNTKARMRQEKEPNKLVVNGNKLHLNDILGAVRYVDATLSQLVRFENTDVLNYANKLIKERSANNIRLAESLLVQKKFADAETILDNALAEDSRNPILLALVGKIYFEEGRYLEGANTWGRALTFSPNSEYLKNYLTCLVRLGRSVDASKYLEFCIEQNPEHATFLRNLEQEILQEY
jgi:tetratricopeptide (TPR) repeat protein